MSSQSTKRINDLPGPNETAWVPAFFRSLAESRAEKAICIVLTGTGYDGTKGLKVVRAAGGMAMAQEEVQARYSGMPQKRD